MCMHSVLWCCWLGNMEGIWPVKRTLASFPQSKCSSCCLSPRAHITDVWAVKIHSNKILQSLSGGTSWHKLTCTIAKKQLLSLTYSICSSSLGYKGKWQCELGKDKVGKFFFHMDNYVRCMEAHPLCDALCLQGLDTIKPAYDWRRPNGQRS